MEQYQTRPVGIEHSRSCVSARTELSIFHLATHTSSLNTQPEKKAYALRLYAVYGIPNTRL